MSTEAIASAKKLFRKELEGIKPYVPGKPIEEVKREYGIEDIVKIASNENPLGPSKLAIEAIISEAKNINIYPDPAVSELRSMIAKKYKVNENQLVFSNGGEELIKLLAETFLNEGDEVLMGDITFSLYEITTKLMGGIPVKAPMNHLAHDLNAFEERISDKTKIIYICNPNNPVGDIVYKDELEKFVSNLREDILLVMDEAYFEYAKRRSDNYPDGLEILKERPNTLVLRTFSKVAGIAGVRIAYGITSEEIVTQMSKIKGVFHVNRIAQAAAVGALKDEEHINKTVNLNYDMICKLEKYFDSKGLGYIPSYTNFIFVNINKDSRIVNEELLKKGIVIRPGFLWGLDNWIRVSTGTEEEIQKFIDAIDSII